MTATTSPTITAVHREWAHLAEAPATREALEKWASHEPALTADSLEELLENIRSAPAAGKDQILHALIQLTGEGDPLAGRVMLQTMLPCLSRRVHSIRPPHGITLDEMWQRALSEFWNVLLLPRTQARTHGIAAALRLDTLHALTRHRHHPGADVWDRDSLGYTGLGTEDGSEWREQTNRNQVSTGDAELFARVVVAARRDGLISVEDAQFLTEVCSSPDPDERTLVQAARRLGKPRAGVAKRFNRICAKLAEASDLLLAEVTDPELVIT